MKKSHSSTIESLKVIIEDVLLGMSKDLVRKILRLVKKKAVLCVQENGGHLEQLM